MIFIDEIMRVKSLGDVLNPTYSLTLPSLSSLERRSPRPTGNDSVNFEASVLVNGDSLRLVQAKVLSHLPQPSLVQIHFSASVYVSKKYALHSFVAISAASMLIFFN